ncbi:MAG TPA: hypothetical protein VMV19_05800, partial [Xanthobacteraceae bacterium]|nr:hypothetical protein [Xanthobacteraceae bacterium]
MDCFAIARNDDNNEKIREAERRQAHAIHCPRHIPGCRHPKMPGAEARRNVSALAYRRFAAAFT